MELGTLFLVRDEANKAMRRLGCDSACCLPERYSGNRYIWSCSESNDHNSWFLSFYNGSFNSRLKEYSGTTRAVALLSDDSRNDIEENSKSVSESDVHDDVPSEQARQAITKEPSDDELVDMLRQRGYTGNINKAINF